MLESVANNINKLQVQIESLAYAEVTSITEMQFYAIGGMVHTHMGAIDNYLLHIYNYSPGMVFLLYMGLTYFITIPMNIIFLFLGSYTKMNILRIWTCVPLFDGLGYTLLMIKNVHTLLVSARIVSTIHIFLHNYEISPDQHAPGHSTEIWRNCNFTGSSEHCIPIDSNHDFICKKNTVYTLSLLEFISINVLQLNFNHVYINIKWLVISSLVWLTTSFAIVLGLRRFVKIFVILLIIQCIGFIVIFALIIWSVPKNELDTLQFYNESFKDKYMFLFTVQFWLIILTSSSTSSEMIGMVWLGSVKPSEIKLNLPIVLILCIKLLCIFLHVHTYKSCIDHLILPHITLLKKCLVNIFDPNITTSFVLIVLLHLKFGNVVIFIYVMAQVIYGLLENSLSIFFMVEAIVDKFVNLKKRRVLIGLTICVLNFIISIPFTTSIKHRIIITWDHLQTYNISTVLLLVITVALIYIYSLDMIVSDHLFTYGEEPSTIVKASWCTCPFIALLTVCGFLYRELFKREMLTSFYYGMGYILVIIMFLPIMIIFVIQIARGVNNNQSPDLPDYAWGPYSEVEKVHRQLFIPQRDLCYRHDSVTCSHKCLIKVKSFEEEVTKQTLKYHMALKKFNFEI